ncbi:MAG: thymidylate synthase, partial [Candidatus Vogelbacteria bacterium]|nr:thymidylate synthase [Candidatus Vogelbacteria bacterium]
KVYVDGQLIKDGDKKLRELLNVFIICENPTKGDEILDKKADKNMINWMLGNFLKQEPVLNWGYSYGLRFFNYHGINQLQQIIDKLKKNNESKSATISLMDPLGDSGHMPCICVLDFKIRKGYLLATAFFRSQDAGKKLYADIISLGKIMEIVSGEVGIKMGELSVLIASLHIYEEDLEEIVLPLIESK